MGSTFLRLAASFSSLSPFHEVFATFLRGVSSRRKSTSFLIVSSSVRPNEESLTRRGECLASLVTKTFRIF